MNSPEWSRLHVSMAAVNRAEIGSAEREHGIRFLDNSGPVYELCGIRVRGLFVDQSGRDTWVDVALWHESATGNTRRFTEWALDRVGGDGLGFDLDVVTMERGWHSASIVRVGDLADLCELDQPSAASPGWARSWRTFTWLDDHRGIALDEAGVPREPSLFDSCSVTPRRHLAVVRQDPRYEAALDAERMLHAQGEFDKSAFARGAFPGLLVDGHS